MWLASFAFSFPNYWTAKLSRCNDQVCLRDDQRSFCCCFNECGHLELVNIAWKHPSRQEVEMWFGCKIIWKITLRRVDAVSGYFFCCCLSLQDPLAASSAWTSSFLSVGTPVGAEQRWEKNKLSCQSDLLSPPKWPGECLLLPWTWGRRLPQPLQQREIQRRIQKEQNAQTRNESDFRGYVDFKKMRQGSQGAWDQIFWALANLLFIYISKMTKCIWP